MCRRSPVAILSPLFKTGILPFPFRWDDNNRSNVASMSCGREISRFQGIADRVRASWLIGRGSGNSIVGYYLHVVIHRTVGDHR